MSNSRCSWLLSLAVIAALSGCGHETFVAGDAGLDVVADAPLDHLDSPGETEDGCSSREECDDSDPCTRDECEVETGSCSHGEVDTDGDGHPAETVEGVECGGDDCDDLNSTVRPGAPSIPCSTLDHDCNGSSDDDNDGDGHRDWACDGGDDCDDGDPETLRGECWGVGPCCDGCNQAGGCWLDESTGYIWEDPPRSGYLDHPGAIAYCDSLSLAGFGAGEWRLPTLDELRTLVVGCPATEFGGPCCAAEYGPCCSGDSCIDEACCAYCEGCPTGGGPGAGGLYWNPSLEGSTCFFWSSSYETMDHLGAWWVAFGNARIDSGGWRNEFGVRCVHTGG